MSRAEPTHIVGIRALLLGAETVEMPSNDPPSNDPWSRSPGEACLVRHEWKVAAVTNTAPSRLKVNGLTQALGVGSDAPILGWTPGGNQSAACLVVRDPAGAVMWDSGLIAGARPEVRYAGPALSPRTRYSWRVRTVSAEGFESPFSEEQVFETALFKRSDWQARWIARRTPASRRTIRSISSDIVSWIDEGHSLGQTFRSEGPLTAVSVDLTRDPGASVEAELRLTRSNGDIVASRQLGGSVPWDRFSAYLEITPPAPAGVYTVSVLSRRSRIGWRTLSAPETEVADDGVSPIPVRGVALRDGQEETGVRTLGVDTMPAPNPLFRARFVVAAKVQSARLYAVGLGYGHFAINGDAVSADVLDPAPTAYDRTVLYRTYDVTPLLRIGENTITARLGRGFYSARGASTWAWHLAPWHSEPSLIAQLEYEDVYGRRNVVVSGEGWETTEGDVVSELLYSGEELDPGRAERPTWEPCLPVTGPTGELRTASLPPIRRFDAVAPVSVEHRDRETTVYDFGAIIAGRVRVLVSGEAGARLSLRYGEYLRDGAVFCENALVAGDAQTDRIVFPPSPEQPVTWEPEFSYKGFRYVSVQAPAGTAIHQIKAVPVRTEVATIGDFACSDDTLSWIDQATSRTFLNNIHGIPTDTPVYEKNGWTADAHLASEALLHHFDLRATFGKWLDDHVDAQDEDGMIPQIVPSPGWGRAPDPAWSASMVLIPWDLYWEYGDLAALERWYEPAQRYAQRLLDIADSGTWPLHSWGDWLSPGHEFPPEGPAPTATMMLHLVVQRLADISAALGRFDSAENYRTAAEEIAAAYHQAYYDPAAEHYRTEGLGYRQTMNVLPLAFGAVPAEHVGSVFRSLVDDIHTRTRGHLDCGAVGVKYLLPVLSDHGRPDLALEVATQLDRPGWGVWKQLGLQTLCESWDATARSHEHYFLGSPAAWLHQHVAGLRATAPGWSTFDVAPLKDDRVTWARIGHCSAYGRISAEWWREEENWNVRLEIPHGSAARLVLPGGAPMALSAGVHRLTVDRAYDAAASNG